MPNCWWISEILLARTVLVWDTDNSLQARTAFSLFKVFALIQWTVMPRKLLLCPVQLSAVVATWLTSLRMLVKSAFPILHMTPRSLITFLLEGRWKSEFRLDRNSAKNSDSTMWIGTMSCSKNLKQKIFPDEKRYQWQMKLGISNSKIFVWTVFCYFFSLLVVTPLIVNLYLK